MKTRAMLAVLVVAALFCSSTRAASSQKNVLEIVSMTNPGFPQSLLQRSVTRGESEAIVSISPEGRTEDWLVTAYTDPAFKRMTDEILRSLECRLPASVTTDGPVRLTLQFSFEAQGAVISLSISDTIDSQIARITGPRRIEKMGTPRQLDQALTSRYTVAPHFPDTPAAAAGDRVVLEFLIDENGCVRMPVLHSGENLPLARAATAALMEWRFSPPTRAGEPVIVAARQEFVLRPSL